MIFILNFIYFKNIIHLTKCKQIYINYEYNNKKAIIKQNNPVASANANPRIAYWNNCGRKEGFLAVASIKLPKTKPIPAPAPDKPIVAKPEPIIFAACTNILL